MINEFTDFLKKYGVIGLAIAVIIGGKANGLVTAIVENLIMPVVGMITPAATGARSSSGRSGSGRCSAPGSTS